MKKSIVVSIGIIVMLLGTQVFAVTCPTLTDVQEYFSKDTVRYDSGTDQSYRSVIMGTQVTDQQYGEDHCLFAGTATIKKILSAPDGQQSPDPLWRDLTYSDGTMITPLVVKFVGNMTRQGGTISANVSVINGFNWHEFGTIKYNSKKRTHTYISTLTGDTIAGSGIVSPTAP